MFYLIDFFICWTFYSNRLHNTIEILFVLAISFSYMVIHVHTSHNLFTLSPTEPVRRDGIFSGSLFIKTMLSGPLNDVHLYESLLRPRCHT